GGATQNDLRCVLRLRLADALSLSFVMGSCQRFHSRLFRDRSKELTLPVRIFQVFDESTNSSVPGSNTWYRNLYEPLLDLGCLVTFVSARSGRIARQRNDHALRARFTEELLRTFKTE